MWMLWISAEMNKQVCLRGGVGVEETRDCGCKNTKLLFECVSSALSRPRHTDGAVHEGPLPTGLHRSGQRDELSIDLQSLNFFVKLDLRTQVRAVFKSLPVRIHIY